MPFCRWGQIVAESVDTVAKIDHLVHHAEIPTLGGHFHRGERCRDSLTAQTHD